MTKSERIAVTGVGIVSALGPDARTTFDRLIAGDRGFGPVTLFDTSGQRTRTAAEISGLRVSDVAPRGQADAWSRSDALAVLAAREALAMARLGDEPVSVAVGGTTGGMYEAEGVLTSMHDGVASDASARRLLSYPLSTTAERLAEVVGSCQRVLTICSACSSGANAIVQGAAWLRHGQARRVLVGGTDGLCKLTFTGFNSLGAVDPEVCRPFDTNRAGLSLGEGAAFLVMEPESVARARGAEVLAWLSGWAIAAEAHHITHPEPSGATASELLRGAMATAGLEPAGIDYVNAHGTGTPHNDAMEGRALARAFADHLSRIWVSSSKGQIGHTLGAAGAIEAAITTLALGRGSLPPTGGLRDPDPELGLRHVMERSQPAKLRAALSSAFGFGGTGCVLAFEHADAADARPAPSHDVKLVVTGAATLGTFGLQSGEGNALYTDRVRADQPSARLELDVLALLDPGRSRRFDRCATFATKVAEAAMADADLGEAKGVGLVAGTAYGNLERSVRFLTRVAERGPKMASPADFPHLVPSAPSGNASIYLGLTGPVVTVSDLAASAEAAIAVASSFIELGLCDAVLAGSAEPHDTVTERVLAPLLGSEQPAPRSEGASFVMLESESAARRRGARVLARVLAHLQGWGSVEAGFSELSAPGARAIVVNGRRDPVLESALDQSAWSAVERRSVMEQSGDHEGVGGVAVAAAVAMLGRGDVDEVLVCGSERERFYLLHLARGGSP